MQNQKRKTLITYRTSKHLKIHNQLVRNSDDFSISVNWITGILPILSGSFVILGMIRSFVYYESFGVAIAKYIDFGEIFTLWFFETILSVLPILAGLFIVLVYYFSSPKNDDEYNRRHFMPFVLYISAVLYYFLEIQKNAFGNYSQELQHFILNSTGHQIAVVLLIVGFVFFSYGVLDYFKTLKKR